MCEGFDLESEVANRVEGFEPTETADTDAQALQLEALALVIDASLSPTERAEGFAHLLASMLARLGPDEARRFHELASERGEYAALVYLTEASQMP